MGIENDMNGMHSTKLYPRLPMRLSDSRKKREKYFLCYRYHNGYPIILLYLIFLVFSV